MRANFDDVFERCPADADQRLYDAMDRFVDDRKRRMAPQEIVIRGDLSRDRVFDRQKRRTDLARVDRRDQPCKGLKPARLRAGEQRVSRFLAERAPFALKAYFVDRGPSLCGALFWPASVPNAEPVTPKPMRSRTNITNKKTAAIAIKIGT